MVLKTIGAVNLMAIWPKKTNHPPQKPCFVPVLSEIFVVKIKRNLVEPGNPSVIPVKCNHGNVIINKTIILLRLHPWYVGGVFHTINSRKILGGLVTVPVPPK